MLSQKHDKKSEGEKYLGVKFNSHQKKDDMKVKITASNDYW